MARRIPIAISSCLLGAKSRYDLSDKSLPEITDAFADDFLWIPLCPEMEIGLGAPREKLDLIIYSNGRRLIGSESRIDYTHEMERHAVARARELSHVCGYILKSKSPSCDPSDGKGLFSETVHKYFPHIPMVGEKELLNNEGRKSFMAKVLAYHQSEHLSNA